MTGEPGGPAESGIPCGESGCVLECRLHGIAGEKPGKGNGAKNVTTAGRVERFGVRCLHEGGADGERGSWAVGPPRYAIESRRRNIDHPTRAKGDSQKRHAGTDGLSG